MSPPASESAAQRLDAAVEAYTKLLTPDFATDDLFVSADFAPGVGPDFDALMRASLARTDLRVAVMIGPEIRFTLDDDSALTEVRFAQRVLGALRDDARSRGRWLRMLSSTSLLWARQCPLWRWPSRPPAIPATVSSGISSCRTSPPISSWTRDHSSIPYWRRSRPSTAPTSDRRRRALRGTRRRDRQCVFSGDTEHVVRDRRRSRGSRQRGRPRRADDRTRSDARRRSRGCPTEEHSHRGESREHHDPAEDRRVPVHCGGPDPKGARHCCHPPGPESRGRPVEASSGGPGEGEQRSCRR